MSVDIISLEDNIARMEKELEDMKKELKKQKPKEKRLLFDEVRAGDWAIDEEGSILYISSGKEDWYECELLIGSVWPTEELSLRELKWRKARASLIREISKINEGEEATGLVWEADWSQDTLSFILKTCALSAEPFLRLQRAPTEEEKKILDPLFMVYFGAEE